MAIVEQDIAFAGATTQLTGLLAQPDGSGHFPGVVVIHEAFGLNVNIKSVTRRLAGEGYAALGVDLFGERNRAVCMARFFGGIFFNSLDHDGIKNLKATLSYLSDQPHVDKERIGAIGFCMGGSFAIAWAATDNRLKAIAPYYGMNPRPLEAVKRSCPVVGSYPEKDFTKPMGEKLDAALTEYGIRHDFKTYPNTHHSFFNETRGSYNEEAAEDSWQRVLAFFRANV